MTSSLENLADARKPLAAEPADDNEITGLLRSGCARLADARNHTLSPESRFDLAYNAAHALCLAALRRQGYRARHRYPAPTAPTNCKASPLSRPSGTLFRKGRGKTEAMT